MVEYTTVKIPVKLHKRVKSKIKKESNGYVSIGDFVRSAIRNELRDEKPIVQTEPNNNKITPVKRSRHKKDVRTKGDPEKKNTVAVYDEAEDDDHSGGYVYGGRLRRMQKLEDE